MAAHFMHHSVITLAEQAEEKSALVDIKPELTEDLAGSMTFQNFDISQVLQQGTVLVASGGQVHLLSVAVEAAS